MDVAAEVLRAARATSYENDRPEIRALVPADARRVLDVGCSSGALGAALKARGAVVVGLERDPGYAATARERLDRVLELDLDAQVTLDEGPFDVIVAADVLEHLREPGVLLADLVRGALAPGGTVVVSLPNVRYWETFWQLGVRGTFPRRSQGIFDRTHLRWFTLHDAHVLLQEAGLDVVEVRRILRPRPTGPSDGRLVRLLARPPLRTFLTFQHVLVGRRPA